MHYPCSVSDLEAYFRPTRLLFDTGTLPPMANGSDDSGKVSFLDDASS